MSNGNAIIGNNVLKNLPEHKENKNLSEVFIEIKKGNLKVKNKFISNNLKLVRKVSQKFINSHVDIDDIFSAGVIGLIHSIDKFDPEYETKFSTYSQYWIEYYITEELRKYNNNLYVPVHTIKASNKVFRVKKELEKDGKEPSIDEIARKTNKSVKSVNQLISLRDNVTFTDNDYIAEMSIEDNSDEYSNIINKKTITKVMSKLDRIEKEVISLRFGIYDDNPLTLNEIGNMLNLTGESIRKIELKAITKLKSILR